MTQFDGCDLSLDEQEALVEQYFDGELSRRELGEQFELEGDDLDEFLQVMRTARRQDDLGLGMDEAEAD